MTDDLPAPLRPNSTISLLLPQLGLVEVGRCTPAFEQWSGDMPPFTLGGKPLVSLNGDPIFAELAILRMLEADGWKGACVQEYGGLRFYGSMPKSANFAGAEVAIPSDKREVLSAIYKVAGRKGGCPDVFTWKAGRLLFCEAKHAKHDRVTESQLRWFDAALEFGIAKSSLLIAEWHFNSL